MSKHARKRGWQKRRLVNPERTASIVVYEATPGAYEAWCVSANREPTPDDPFPMPVVAFDLWALPELFELLELPELPEAYRRPPPPPLPG